MVHRASEVVARENPKINVTLHKIGLKPKYSMAQSVARQLIMYQLIAMQPLIMLISVMKQNHG